MLVTEQSIAAILICPVCAGGGLTRDADGALACRAPDCATAGESFPLASGKSVLVDFAASVLDRGATVGSAASSVLGRRTPLRRKLLERIEGGNPITPYFAADMLERVAAAGRAAGRNGRLLVVGGGTVGSGSESLYERDDVDVIAFDVYCSDAVSFVADGHAIPLASASIDGVWIQAVLEHVLDPAGVVAEIHRVLDEAGLVFADTPFLWPVHEAAYDYTRWTPSGHRWLFRDFAVVEAGVSSGPGRTALLGLRYLGAAIFGSYKIGQALTLPVAWLRLLDRFCRDRWSLDACAGLFFYGQRAPAPISPKDIVAFYDQQPALQARVRNFERQSRELVRQGGRKRAVA